MQREARTWGSKSFVLVTLPSPFKRLLSSAFGARSAAGKHFHCFADHAIENFDPHRDGAGTERPPRVKPRTTKQVLIAVPGEKISNDVSAVFVFC